MQSSEQTAIAASVASSAPIFALLIVLRLGASPAVPAEAPTAELVVTVQEAGWALRLGAPTEAHDSALGPTCTWVPRLAGRQGALLRRAARDLSHGAPLRSVMLRAGDGVAYDDVRWAGEALAALAPVRIDAGPLALADQPRLRQARPEGMR